MKRISVYGACQRGIEIIEIINNSIIEEVEVVNFIDKNEMKIGGKIKDIPIISLKQFSEESNKEPIDEIIIASNEIHHMKIIKQIGNFNTKKIVIPNNKNIDNIEECKKYKFEEIFVQIKPILNYLEFHVCDSCNLNCKGCGHFANLAPKNSFASIEQFKKDIKRLSELFYNILKIRILGGEPLLNKELGEFIIETRKAFPNTDLRIVTNGLLLPEISKELIGIIKNNNVFIDISWYKPTIHMKDKIVNFLLENGLNYDESGINIIEEFSKQITISDENDKYNAARKCGSNECYFLENGLVSKCGLPFLIKYLKEKFKIDEFSNENVRKSLLDIHNKSIDGYSVFDFLDEPSEFCKHCSEIHKFYKWKIRNTDSAKLDDWII